MKRQEKKKKKRTEKRHPKRTVWMTGDGELCLVKLKCIHFIAITFFFSSTNRTNIDNNDWHFFLSWSYTIRSKCYTNGKLKNRKKNIVLQFLVQTSHDCDTDECGKVFCVSKIEGGKHQNVQSIRTKQTRKRSNNEGTRVEVAYQMIVMKMNISCTINCGFSLFLSPCQLSWKITRKFS